MDANDYDWVIISPRSDSVLHAPVLDAAQRAALEEEALIQGGATLCGRKAHITLIPGLGHRMGGKRCNTCCDRLGYPRGTGSPKNDADIRQRLGLPPV